MDEFIYDVSEEELQKDDFNKALIHGRVLRKYYSKNTNVLSLIISTLTNDMRTGETLRDLPNVRFFGRDAMRLNELIPDDEPYKEDPKERQDRRVSIVGDVRTLQEHIRDQKETQASLYRRRYGYYILGYDLKMDKGSVFRNNVIYINGIVRSVNHHKDKHYYIISVDTNEYGIVNIFHFGDLERAPKPGDGIHASGAFRTRLVKDRSLGRDRLVSSLVMPAIELYDRKPSSDTNVVEEDTNTEVMAKVERMVKREMEDAERETSEEKEEASLDEEDFSVNRFDD